MILCLKDFNLTNLCFFILGFSQVHDIIKFCQFHVKHQSLETLRLENLQISTVFDICDVIESHLSWMC